MRSPFYGMTSTVCRSAVRFVRTTVIISLVQRLMINVDLSRKLHPVLMLLMHAVSRHELVKFLRR